MSSKLSWQERSAKLIYITLILLLIAAAVFIGLVLKDLLIIFIFALCLNYLLTKPVDFLTKYLPNRAIITIIVLSSIISILALVVSSIYPIVKEQFINFIQVIPSIENKINTLSLNISQSVGVNLDLPIEMQNFTDNLNKKNIFVASFKHSIYLITFFVMILIVSFYLLVDGNKVWALFAHLFPKQYDKAFQEVKMRIDSNLNSLIIGQFKIASITSLVMFTSYLAIGNSFAILLGLLQMLEFIPIFGTWAAFIPAIIVVTATSGTTKALIVAIIYLIHSQIIRDHFLVPKIMGAAFGIHPLAVILGLALGFKSIGPLGIIVALPVIGIISAVLHYLIKVEHMEDT